jgi:hypothetical protein
MRPTSISRRPTCTCSRVWRRYSATHVRDGDRQLPLVVARPLLADLDHHGDGVLGAPFGDGEHELEQALLHAGSERRRHAEVEQRKAFVVGEEYVAGVRVGVKKAVDQDLL